MIEKANDLANKIIIIDTHIDVPYRLESRYEDISIRTKHGHFDYPRAKEGGLDAAFMAVYIPAYFEKKGGGKYYADKLIDLVLKIVNEHPDKFSFADSVEDVQNNFKSGSISLLIGMENATPLEGNIKNVEYFYNRGIRYITLAHSESNHISDSSYDVKRIWNGLSPFGKEVIIEMNRLGMMVDVSHISDKAFYDIINISQVPVIASHSSCRHFTPGWERNMDDEMIKTLAQHGGVIMINFGTSFIDNEARIKNNILMNELKRILASKNLSLYDPASLILAEEFLKENSTDDVPVSKVADHIDHIINLAGIGYVGLGSDFDGVFTVPKGLEDVSKYPNLINELLKRGYTGDNIEKILSGNILRVWKEVENFAEEKNNVSN